MINPRRAVALARRLVASSLVCFVAWVSAGEFQLTILQPEIDRWMYPFNIEPATRPSAPTYGSFDTRFDTRDGQFVLGWDTAGLVTAGAAPRDYLLRRLRVTLTAIVVVDPERNIDGRFRFDGTQDDYRTYLTNDVAQIPDPDPGRPAEIFGAGFREGWTAATFKQDSPFGKIGAFCASNCNIAIGTRVVYAAMVDTNGVLADVSNNVGQLNPDWQTPAFEVKPWAVGQAVGIPQGELVEDDTKFTFDLDLTDPLITGFLESALAEGRLRLVVSSLHRTSELAFTGGFGVYPTWATKQNLLYDAPRLELEGTVIGDVDSDADGLPDDWERFYFADLQPTASGDDDGDGASNQSEFLAGTNPNSAGSVFRILSVKFDPHGSATLRFLIAPSRHYRVQVTEDLTTWTDGVGQLSFPETGVAEWREEDLSTRPAARTRAWFRIVAE